MDGPSSYNDYTIYNNYSPNGSLDQDAIKEGVPTTFGVRSLSSSLSNRSGSPTRTLSREFLYCYTPRLLLTIGYALLGIPVSSVGKSFDLWEWMGSERIY
jgi:hypothetical protein